MTSRVGMTMMLMPVRPAAASAWSLAARSELATVPPLRTAASGRSSGAQATRSIRASMPSG
jgi:hypothetical protein